MFIAPLLQRPSKSAQASRVGIWMLVVFYYLLLFTLLFAIYYFSVYFLVYFVRSSTLVYTGVASRHLDAARRSQNAAYYLAFVSSWQRFLLLKRLLKSGVVAMYDLLLMSGVVATYDLLHHESCLVS